MTVFEAPRYGPRIVRAMHDAHLVNALLKALNEGDAPEASGVQVLAVEVKRRDIEERAVAEVRRRRAGL